MFWGEASWLSCGEMGQTGSNQNLELDPPTEPSKTGRALGAGRSRTTG